MNKKKKIRLVIICLLIVFAIVKILNPIIIRDADTGIPIANAEVKIEISNFADGCGKPTYKKTNALGIIFSPSLFVCRISAWHDGYHVNGYNNVSEAKKFLIKNIVLHKMGQPVEPVAINIRASQNDGVDILSNIKSEKTTEATLDGIKTQDNVDFYFSSIVNEGKANNTSGPYKAKIKFLGEGGIQKITNLQEPNNHGGYNYFAMENMLTAPMDGYQKELILESGQSYVAKLRDGKHYFKFHPFMADYFEDTKEPYICMTSFINPEENSNLNFKFIYDGSIFCGDTDPILMRSLTFYQHLDKWFTQAYPQDESWKKYEIQ